MSMKSPLFEIDFVLAQYHGSAWDDLRMEEPRYGRLCRPAMQRYWTPYFRSLADALQGAGQVPHDGEAGLLLPNIVTG